MGLLIHTRRVGQRIRVGDEIEITVLEIDGNKVRLGFLAPSEIPIHRLEVWQKIQAEGVRRPPRASSTAPERERRRPA